MRPEQMQLFLLGHHRCIVAPSLLSYIFHFHKSNYCGIRLTSNNNMKTHVKIMRPEQMQLFLLGHHWLDFSKTNHHQAISAPGLYWWTGSPQLTFPKQTSIKPSLEPRPYWCTHNSPFFGKHSQFLNKAAWSHHFFSFSFRFSTSQHQCIWIK